MRLLLFVSPILAGSSFPPPTTVAHNTHSFRFPSMGSLMGGDDGDSDRVIKNPDAGVSNPPIGGGSPGFVPRGGGR